MSFSFSKNARVTYIPNDKPIVKKDIYIKNNLTLVALIPILSANLEDTSKPLISKK